MDDNTRHHLSSPVLTVREFVAHWAKENPKAYAIAAPGRASLTYKGLSNQVDVTVESLHAMGVGRNDRVAMVVPNGPEAAVAFLAVSSGAVSAPINPYLQAEEFDFLLSDLKPRAFIIQSGIDSPAINIAEKREIPIVRLSPVLEESAGVFALSSNRKDRLSAGGFAESDDVALVLHTSGTTSRPKMVPLTHGNICNSAHNIRTVLKLTPVDCCLNVMPLFHIHGLIGALLSTISAGASIFCTPGFYAPRFYDWMKECHPTWYTAVPTIHQAILARSKNNLEIISHSKLRFIRSSSSALPPQVMADLEKTFGVPVIESYGMTEASHQMASNPLPPHTRKVGTVGLSAGPEIEIMDPQGNLLPHGAVGEVVIRGRTVMRGYGNNPDANALAYVKGWFRTGDQGYLDQECFLTITGRLKEIINRGGEKISPREIDEVLLDHPNVAQAVTFGLPDPKLGEDVAAAIVLREGANATEWEIQQFVARRLADYKIPRRIVFLKEIPKGPTGKIQRIGLAARLGFVESVHAPVPEAEAEYKAPSTPLEEKVARIWSRVLGVGRIGVNDNFFELGGDSIQARVIVSELSKALQIRSIPLAIFLHAPTIEKMAYMLDAKEFFLPSASLTAIQPKGSKAPLYFVHACEGEVLFLTDLARRLGPDQPFYAMRAQGLDRNTTAITRVEDMAAHYLQEIQGMQPHGPYLLGGAGVGGIVALEMAQQLRTQVASVAALILIDTRLPRPLEASTTSEPRGHREKLERYLHRVFYYLKHRQEAITLAKSLFDHYYRHVGKIFVRRFRVWDETQKAVDRYLPKPYPGRTALFLPEKRVGFGTGPQPLIDAWRRLAVGPFEAHVLHVLPGEHLNMLKEPYVLVLGELVKTCLDNAVKNIQLPPDRRSHP
jgi:acyl-CoA synthetase (AMP-forming)/AMP-acid ligase II/thioesterase domain-containing protein/acyl carrier protein